MHTFHMVSLFGRTVIAKKMTFDPSTTLMINVIVNVNEQIKNAYAMTDLRCSDVMSVHSCHMCWLVDMCDVGRPAAGLRCGLFRSFCLCGIRNVVPR